jgi:hypothetical protein
MDGLRAKSVLGMAMRRLRFALDERVTLDDAERGEILLLLDETARIPAFDAREFVSVVRENHIGYVLVYQNTSMISEAEEEVAGVLNNIGMEIYLRSLRGNDLERINARLPEWERMRLLSGTGGGEDRPRGFTEHVESDSFLSKRAAARFPSGRYPALVVPRELASPFLVDLDAAVTGGGTTAGAPLSAEPAYGAGSLKTGYWESPNGPWVAGGKELRLLVRGGYMPEVLLPEVRSALGQIDGGNRWQLDQSYVPVPAVAGTLIATAPYEDVSGRTGWVDFQATMSAVDGATALDLFFIDRPWRSEDAVWAHLTEELVALTTLHVGTVVIHALHADPEIAPTSVWQWLTGGWFCPPQSVIYADWQITLARTGQFP